MSKKIIVLMVCLLSNYTTAYSREFSNPSNTEQIYKAFSNAMMSNERWRATCSGASKCAETTPTTDSWTNLYNTSGWITLTGIERLPGSAVLITLDVDGDAPATGPTLAFHGAQGSYLSCAVLDQRGRVIRPTKEVSSGVIVYIQPKQLTATSGPTVYSDASIFASLATKAPANRYRILCTQYSLINNKAVPSLIDSIDGILSVSW